MKMRALISPCLCLFIVLVSVNALGIEFSTYPYGKNVEEFINVWAGDIHGIAVETHLGGEFFDSIGRICIYLNQKKMRRVAFNFTHGKGYIVIQDFNIHKTTRVSPQKISFTGVTDNGYDFIAYCSISNDRLNFQCVIEGRGRVELKNIGPNGIRLKKKYLDNIELGFTNRDISAR
jgi:hypothetical protein